MKTNPSNAAVKKAEIQEKLVMGEITIAEAIGISKDQLYEIAERGYQLLSSGKLEEARQVYAGLVAADPYDSVFHCHLGAILWRLGKIEEAFAEYDASLRYNLANVDALAGRGELYWQKGDIKAGIEDFRKAVELDPEGIKPSSIRARALLLSLNKVAKTAA